MTLKYTPRLSFRLDESVERGVRVLNVIEQVDDLPLAADDDEDEDDDDFEEFEDGGEDSEESADDSGRDGARVCGDR